MSEDVIEQERQPVISNLFPVEEQAARTVFRYLSRRGNPSGYKEEVDKEKNQLNEINPHVFLYIKDTLGEISRQLGSKEAEDQIMWGVLISHRALRVKAKSREGVLPTLTDDFVKEFQKQEIENIITLARNENKSTNQAAKRIAKQELARFESYEPEFSQIAREELSGSDPNWDPEQDRRYSGIIDLYLLFREGCSDPKNFAQNPQ